MSIDERLRSHLRARAAGIEPEGADARDIATRARRRTATRAAAGAGLVVVVIAAVVGAGLLARDRGPDSEVTVAAGVEDPNESAVDRPASEDEPATAADPPAEPAERADGSGVIDLDRVAGPPGLGTGRVTVGRDGEFLLLDHHADDRSLLYVSADGRGWSTVELELGPGRIASAIVWSGDQYYVAGTSFGEPSGTGDRVSRSSFVAISGDLVDWDVSELPAPAPPQWEGTTWGGSIEHIASGPAGVLLVGTQWIDLDLPTLLGDPNLAEGGWGVYRGADGEIGFELFGPDPEAEDSIRRFTASELGLDPALADLVASGGAATVAWIESGGAGFQLVDTPDLDATWVTGAVATGSGFVVAGTAGSPEIDDAAAALWMSPDGRSWTRVEGPGFGNSDIVGGMAELAGRLTIVGTCEGRPVAWTQSDDGTWPTTDLSDHLDLAADESSAIWLTAGGPTGLVALAEAYPAWPPPLPEVIVEVDGYTMLMDETSSRTTFYAPDGSVIAEVEGTAPPDPSVLPDRLRLTDDTGVEILDESLSEVVAVFTAAQIGAAADEAFAGLLPEDRTEVDDRPRRTLLHSTDGVSWRSTPIAEMVEPGVHLVPTGLAMSESTLLLLGFDEAELIEDELEGDADAEGGADGGEGFGPEQVVTYVAPMP